MKRERLREIDRVREKGEERRKVSENERKRD
jgi:hypothetical protein